MPESTTSTKTDDIDVSRTSILSSRLSAPAKKHLSALVTKLWSQLQPQAASTISKVPAHKDKPILYDDYHASRDKFYEAATLATICDHEQRVDIIKQWGTLQIMYLNHAVTALARKQEEMEASVTLHTDNVNELVSFESEHQRAWKALSAKALSGKIPDKQEMDELALLGKKVEDLQESRKELEGYQHAFNSLGTAVNELKELQKLPPNQQIHYILQSPEQIFNGLKDGTYSGLTAEPFEILAGVQHQPLEKIVTTKKSEPVTTVAPRQAYMINPSEKPPELIALLELKRIIDTYPVGKKFGSGDVTKDLPQDYLFGPKSIGSYLELVPEIFGVDPDRSGQQRKFIKRDIKPRTEEEFMVKILENLRTSEAAAFSRFYITRALNRIRTDPTVGYNPFTTKMVRDNVIHGDNVNFPLKTIGVNLGRLGDEYCIRLLDVDEDERRFEFIEVIPTDDHRKYIADAIKTFGYEPFSSTDICRRISEKKIALNHRVPEYLLEKDYQRFGLKRQKTGDRVTYESITRPPTAMALVEAAKKTADMEDLC